jgi:transposase
MRTQLKKLTMYNEVKELSQEGLSIRQISKNTGLDRVPVRKYLRMTEEEFSDFLALQKQRNRKLQPYEEFIKKRVTDYPDCSSAQVEDWLKEHHPDFQEVTTRTIYSFVQWVRKSHDIPKPKGTLGTISRSSNYLTESRRRWISVSTGWSMLMSAK